MLEPVRDVTLAVSVTDVPSVTVPVAEDSVAVEVGVITTAAEELVMAAA